MPRKWCVGLSRSAPITQAAVLTCPRHICVPVCLCGCVCVRQVAIAERFAAQRRAAAAEGKDSEANTFGSILQDAGIVNPVTKQGAGNLYHDELARQIALFLR